VAVRGNDLGREIEALEVEIAKLRALEHEEDSAVAALREEVEARLGRLSLTRRALADHQEAFDKKRSELDQKLAEQARQLFEQVLQERSAAGESVAEAAEILLTRLHDLDTLDEEARSAWQAAQLRASATGNPLDTAAGDELAADPEVMRESWDRLSHEVRKRIDENFEHELVEAAAQSPMGHAIPNLPEHLRELARQRRLDLARRSDASRAKTR
jgi:DNA repair exonuclease SbcCD ATPase subunit